MRTLTLCCLWLTFPVPASAHSGEAHDVVGWTFDPVVLAPMVLTVALHMAGFVRLSSRRPGFAGRQARPVLLFLSGLMILIAALVSPLHELGEHLFTAHMVEHEMIMAIAAPLLVLARPGGFVLWGLPDGARQTIAPMLAGGGLRSLWRWLTSPTVATLGHGAAIWIWHAPALFDATTESLALHRLQHVSFLATAIFFWWAITWRARHGVAAWHLFITMLHTSILGALIALSPRVIYLAQTRLAPEWGLTALEDQQLAGLLMWVPGGTVYAGAALWLLMRWIGHSHEGELNADPV